MEKPLPCHTPSSLKHGKRIVGQKLGQARYPIVILVVICISEPSQAQCSRFLEVSRMAKVVLEALDGSDSTARRACAGLENLCAHRK